MQDDDNAANVDENAPMQDVDNAANDEENAMNLETLDLENTPVSESIRDIVSFIIDTENCTRRNVLRSLQDTFTMTVSSRSC